MKILYLTNIPSPYRVEFFNNVSISNNLTVIFDAMHAKDRNNNWFDNKKIKFNYQIIKPGNIIKLYKVLNKEYDIIVIGGYSTLNGALSIELLKLKRKKFIINADGGFIAKDNFFTKWLKKHFISSATYWLSTSKGTSEYLLNYGANKNNIYIYPFTSLLKKEILEEPITNKNKKTLRKDTPFDCEKLYVSVGQFIHRKGFDVLLKAFNDKKHINNKLLIIGGGPLKEEYEKYIEDNKIKNVFILDFLKKEKLLEVYKYSDVFVLPTREDIWGLVVNEAMSLGLPVISTYQCLAATELLSKEYLYNSENTNHLGKLLIDLKNKTDKELYDIGKQNIKKSKSYTIENMTKVHIEIFKKICKLEKKNEKKTNSN